MYFPSINTKFDTNQEKSIIICIKAVSIDRELIPDHYIVRQISRDSLIKNGRFD